MIKLEHLVKKIEDLPPLPEIVVKLLKASRDPNVSMREMVELIKHDPALTIKVLRLCKQLKAQQRQLYGRISRLFSKGQ